MKRDMNIPDTFPEIRPEDIPVMAKYADQEGNPVYPVPRLMDAKELERFYVQAAETLGEPVSEPARNRKRKAAPGTVREPGKSGVRKAAGYAGS